MGRCGGPGGVQVGADGRGIQSQAVRGVERACRVEEIAPLRLGDGEGCAEPFSERT